MTRIAIANNRFEDHSILDTVHLARFLKNNTIHTAQNLEVPTTERYHGLGKREAAVLRVCIKSFFDLLPSLDLHPFSCL